MTFRVNEHKVFNRVAKAILADVNACDDATIHDVLAALMDHIGVPMMAAKDWEHVPAIVALFAERGVTFQAISGPYWAVNHPGLGVLEYGNEDAARVAAGTAGTLLTRDRVDGEWRPARQPGPDAGQVS